MTLANTAHVFHPLYEQPQPFAWVACTSRLSSASSRRGTTPTRFDRFLPPLLANIRPASHSAPWIRPFLMLGKGKRPKRSNLRMLWGPQILRDHKLGCMNYSSGRACWLCLEVYNKAIGKAQLIPCRVSICLTPWRETQRHQFRNLTLNFRPLLSFFSSFC